MEKYIEWAIKLRKVSGLGKLTNAANKEKNMKQVILYGAGVCSKNALDFLRFCNMDIYIYALCESNPEKTRKKFFDKSIISYAEAKEKNYPFVISVSEKYHDEIQHILEQDGVKYFDGITQWLQLEFRSDFTKLNRDYCAYFHIEGMDEYFDIAESENSLKRFWGENTAFYRMFMQLDLDKVIELACGRGRHLNQYYSRANEITLVDILEKNIAFCKDRFRNKRNIKYYQNNGFDLSELPNEGYSALFTYDSMVHFEMFDINNYLKETFRVLKNGGMALFHHSNLASDYRQTYNNSGNPGGRNFMSKELFAYLAYKAGFEIIEQQVIDWSLPSMDCITLVKKF